MLISHTLTAAALPANAFARFLRNGRMLPRLRSLSVDYRGKGRSREFVLIHFRAPSLAPTRARLAESRAKSGDQVLSPGAEVVIRRSIHCTHPIRRARSSHTRGLINDVSCPTTSPDNSKWRRCYEKCEIHRRHLSAHSDPQRGIIAEALAHPPREADRARVISGTSSNGRIKTCPPGSRGGRLHPPSLSSIGLSDQRRRSSSPLDRAGAAEIPAAHHEAGRSHCASSGSAQDARGEHVVLLSRLRN
jgi:hypothetical protein